MWLFRSIVSKRATPVDVMELSFELASVASCYESRELLRQNGNTAISQGGMKGRSSLALVTAQPICNTRSSRLFAQKIPEQIQGGHGLVAAKNVPKYSADSISSTHYKY
jgi:hypothetical protein